MKPTAAAYIKIVTAGKALQNFIYFFVLSVWVAKNEMNVVFVNKGIVAVQDPMQVKHVFGKPGMTVIL